MRDTARFVIVSPECLSVLVALMCWIFWAPLFFTWGTVLRESDKAMFQTHVIAPVTILTASLVLGWKVLFPLSNNRLLLRWPDYSKLKGRVVFAGLVELVGLLVLTVAYIAAAHVRPDIIMLVTLCSGAAMLSALVTLTIATVTVRQIMERET